MTMIYTTKKLFILYTIYLVCPLLLFSQSQKYIKAHTEYLASDKLEGRGTGSNGIQLAAAYIAQQFEEIGLQKINGESFYQKFPFPGQEEMEANIIGIIQADKPSQKSVVFTAHYDAYGIGKPNEESDSIYNGAQDNAVGVAALIELARLFKSDPSPQHNIVFVATSGEEFGTHGSKYYVKHPVFPTDEIIICLNIDGFNVSGLREDYFTLPRQGIDFVGTIENILKPLGWHYNSPNWVDVMNTSFDTASFLSQGIPAVTIWTGNRLKGGELIKPVKLGAIHSPNDEINENWNWEGVEDHLILYKTLADFFLENPRGIHVINPQLFEKE